MAPSKFEFDTDPSFIANCHCNDCKRASGGEMATFFAVPEDDFTILSGKRTYWAMVIAGDYEPKGKGKKKDKEPVVAVKREVAPASKPKSESKPKSSSCHVKLLGLCI